MDANVKWRDFTQKYPTKAKPMQDYASLTSRHKHPRRIRQPGKGVDTGWNGHHVLCDDHHWVDVHKPQRATPICHQYVVGRTSVPFKRDEAVIFIVLCSFRKSWVPRLSTVCDIWMWWEGYKNGKRALVMKMIILILYN